MRSGGHRLSLPDRPLTVVRHAVGRHCACLDFAPKGRPPVPRPRLAGCIRPSAHRILRLRRESERLPVRDDQGSTGRAVAVALGVKGSPALDCAQASHRGGRAEAGVQAGRLRDGLSTNTCRLSDVADLSIGCPRHPVRYPGTFVRFSRRTRPSPSKAGGHRILRRVLARNCTQRVPLPAGRGRPRSDPAFV